MKPSPSTIFITLLIAILSASSASNATIHVPGDHPTIQAGIDAAVDGDLVLVAPGTYMENIDFHGKAITLQSEAGAEVTVINGGDCAAIDPLEGRCSVVTFDSGEAENTVLNGFTIRNGSGIQIWDCIWPSPWCWPDWCGGGIFCSSSSPTNALALL